MRNFIKAAVDYTKAIELEGTNPLYYQNRGLAYDNSKQHKKAIDDFSKVL